MFDFFGPPFHRLDATAATSFHFGSPGTSPKLASTLEAASPHIASQQRDSLEDTVETRPAQRSALQPASADAPEHASASEEERLGRAGVRTRAPSAPMLPLYPDEILPDYEEAPEYTPPLSQPSSSSNRSKTSAFRTAAANRFLSSRIAKKLNLPPALQSRLQGTQTPMPTPHRSTILHSHQPPTRSTGRLSREATVHRTLLAPDMQALARQSKCVAMQQRLTWMAPEWVRLRVDPDSHHHALRLPTPARIDLKPPTQTPPDPLRAQAPCHSRAAYRIAPPEDCSVLCGAIPQKQWRNARPSESSHSQARLPMVDSLHADTLLP